MELDECVETLFFLQSTAELESASRFNVLGSRHYHGADEMLLRLSALVSPHAFELVRKEYELFKSGSVSYEGKWLQHSIARLKSLTTDCEYTVDVSVSQRGSIFLVSRCCLMILCVLHADIYMLLLFHANYVASVPSRNVCTVIDGQKEGDPCELYSYTMVVTVRSKPARGRRVRR